MKNIIIISNTSSYQDINLINSKFVSQFKRNLIFCDNVSPVSVDYFLNIFSIFNERPYVENNALKNKLIEILHSNKYNTQAIYSSDELGGLFEESTDSSYKYTNLQQLENSLTNIIFENKLKSTFTFIELNDEKYLHNPSMEQIEEFLYKKIDEELEDYIILYIGNVTSNRKELSIGRIPLFWVMPESYGYAHYCNELIRLTDVFTTILHLLEVQYTSTGNSLLPLFKGEAFRALPAIIDTSSIEKGVKKALIIKNGQQEYQIMWDEIDETFKVFDLSYDPTCSTDLIKL